MPVIERKYPRIKTSTSNQAILRNAGYTPVFSSNVSAIQRDDADLYIRFHNGSVYQYPNKGSEFNDLLTSPSKGEWVWRNLRRTNASYIKVGGFPLTGDLDLTDEELMRAVEQQESQEVARLISGVTTLSTFKPSDMLLTSLATSDIITLGLITTLFV